MLVATRNVKIGSDRYAPGDAIKDGMTPARIADLKSQGHIDEQEAFEAAVAASATAAVDPFDVIDNPAGKPNTKKNRG